MQRAELQTLDDQEDYCALQLVSIVSGLGTQLEEHARSAADAVVYHSSL